MMQTARQEWIEQVLAALNTEGGRRLSAFLQRQRWFGGKGKALAAAHVVDAIALSHGTDRRLLAFVDVEYRGGHPERYAMPLVIRSVIDPGDADALVEFPPSSSREWICDATHDANTWVSLYEDVAQSRELVGEAGCLRTRSIPQGERELSMPVREAKVLSGEQSNTSVVFDRRVILKLIRKVEAGINPDSEMLEFLTTQTVCSYVPSLLGLLTYENKIGDACKPATVAVLQRFVSDSVDGWSYTLTHLERLLGEGPAVVDRGHTLSQAVTDMSGPFLQDMRRLGAMTGELHLALSSQNEPEAFRPEPITAQDVEQWQGRMGQLLTAVCRDLRALPPNQLLAAGLTDEDVTGLETACPQWFGDLRLLSQTGASKIRHHGDYHLGQVLKTKESFVVIDFEGEPARSLEARRAKLCPLKDVGGMLRSFSYAAQVLLVRRRTASATDVGLMEEWERTTRAAFLEGYRATAQPGHVIFLPPNWEDALRIIHVYELEKVLYELGYEMRNRPDWLSVPLTGLRRLCGGSFQG